MNYKLRIKDLHKDYEKTEAIKNISLDIYDGEIIGIVGTSGCGKSTLLNIISGLTTATSGEITFDTNSPKISYMLQNDALLPWKTVFENAILGLELTHDKTDESINYVKKLLKDYGLEEFTNKKPNNLSGGMRQRVALIRSLATKPDILLLDEPFSALDYFTRIKISDDVHKIIKSTNTTTIIITHDIQEALSLSDRIVVLSKRPSIIKKVYKTELNEIESSLEKRKTDKFIELYEKIWRDLDE